MKVRCPECEAVATVTLKGNGTCTFTAKNSFARCKRAAARLEAGDKNVRLNDCEVLWAAVNAAVAAAKR